MSLSKDIRIDLDSEIWGPSGWFIIDSICLSYPSNPTVLDKQQYKNYFYALPYVLPCTKCRKHFNEYITNNPLDEYVLQSRDNLIKWILNAHNNVNKNNNKKYIGIEEFYSFYNSKYKMDVKKDTCKNTCGFKNVNDKSNNIIQKKDPNYKVLSIILFGIVIALSLYLFRCNNYPK